MDNQNKKTELNETKLDKIKYEEENIKKDKSIAFLKKEICILKGKNLDLEHENNRKNSELKTINKIQEEF